MPTSWRWFYWRILWIPFQVILNIWTNWLKREIWNVSYCVIGINIIDFSGSYFLDYESNSKRQTFISRFLNKQFSKAKIRWKEVRLSSSRFNDDFSIDIIKDSLPNNSWIKSFGPSVQLFFKKNWILQKAFWVSWDKFFSELSRWLSVEISSEEEIVLRYILGKPFWTYSPQQIILRRDLLISIDSDSFLASLDPLKERVRSIV